MIRHTIECPDCLARKDVECQDGTHTEKCVCGGEMRVVYDWGRDNTLSIELFKPFVDEGYLNFNPGLKIESKAQLQKECERRGVVSHYLSNRMNNPYRRRREL